MTVAAGIDVGNSTTEVVLARLRAGGIDIMGTARAQTRGCKGSPESLVGAGALVARLERAHQVRVERVSVAHLCPVETSAMSVPQPRDNTGRLRILSTGAATTGGHGAAAGRPHRLGDPVPGAKDPLVAVVPAGFGYRAAIHELARLPRVLAVALEDDEAVLVSNRMDSSVPVIDEVDAAALLKTRLVAIEVAQPGQALRTLTDPLRLITLLGLEDHEREDAARIALQLSDCSSAAVAVMAAPAEPEDAAVPAWVEFRNGRREPFPAAHRLLADGNVGIARSFAVPGHAAQAVDDLWTADLSSIADAVLARRTSSGSREIGIAALRTQASLTDPSPPLAERLGLPASAVATSDESRAAWLGGCSTTAADPRCTVVIDVGAGSIDVVSADQAVVAAGGGHLLTTSVAALTETSMASAEWVKRGAAQRVESPQVLLSEDGSRSFLDRPAPAETIGALVAGGPAGLLSFSRVLAPGEWRALRLRLKVEALGFNVTRSLRSLGVTPGTVIVVGGPAGDDEVLSVVARALPAGVAVGRGDVAGQLGHRYAVAYGLLSLLD